MAYMNPQQYLNALVGIGQGDRYTAFGDPNEVDPNRILQVTGPYQNRRGANRGRPSLSGARAASGTYDPIPIQQTQGGASGFGGALSAISSLRPRGQEFIEEVAQGPPMTDRPPERVYPNPLAPGGYSPMPGAALSAPQDKSDVGDGGGFGIGDYLGGEGVGQAMISAGAGWMEAAGQPGATFGGSLGTGLKGFAAERARFQASQAARDKLAADAALGPDGRERAIRGLIELYGADWTPERIASAVQVARASDDGLEIMSGQLIPATVDPTTATAQSRDVAELHDARATLQGLIAAGVGEDDPEMIVAKQAVNDWELQLGIKELPAQDSGMTDYRFRLDGLARAAGFPGGTEQLMKDDPEKFVQLSREAVGDRQGDVYGKQWMSPAQLANDTALGELERAYYIGGGRGLQMQNLATFDEVVSLIQGQIDRDRRSGVDVESEEYLNSSSRQGNSLMGWVVGNMPFAASMLNPEDANALDLVRAVVFQSLKETLGGQFAEREGERLVAAAYNPMLSPEVNMRRILRLRNNMVQSERWYEALQDYKREHGHLADFDYDTAMKYYVDNPITIGAHLQVSDYEGVTDVSGAVASDIERIVKAERDFGNNPTESLSQVRARLFARFDPEQVAIQGPALLNSVERQIYDEVENYLQRALVRGGRR